MGLKNLWQGRENGFPSYKMNMATITLNSATFRGKTVSIINGKVFVDGKECVDTDKISDKEINIVISGDVEGAISIDSCNSVKVTGNVGQLQTTSGDVQIDGSVTGSVTTTSGDINIGGNVHENVRTVSGDVSADTISGNVSTVSGDIN